MQKAGEGCPCRMSTGCRMALTPHPPGSSECLKGFMLDYQSIASSAAGNFHAKLFSPFFGRMSVKKKNKNILPTIHLLLHVSFFCPGIPGLTDLRIAEFQ